MTKTSITDTSPAPMPAMARLAEAGFLFWAPPGALAEDGSSS